MRVLALLAGLALASCTPWHGEGAQVQEAPGGVARNGGPSIVSLNPCSDAVLVEVADPSQIRALSHYSSDPASSSMDPAVARRFPAVSGTVEEVLALKPDVVIASTYLPPATASALRALGMPVVQLPIAASVAESRAQVAQIAAVAGHPARGRALNARIDAALAAAAPPAGSRPVSAVVWQSGGIVPGEETLVSDLLRRTGFASFSSARGFRQADVLPLEFMLADPPQVILAAGQQGDGGDRGDRMLSHPALASLSATRREAFPSSLLWCGGPTIIHAAGRLAQIRRKLT